MRCRAAEAPTSPICPLSADLPCKSPAGQWMRKGFLFLVAIRCPLAVCLQTARGMDWFTRKVLACRISNTLEAEFCLEALNEALHKFGVPEIMNIDQGSQFTSVDWTDRLKRAKTRISLSAIARHRLPATHGRQSPIPRQPSGIPSDQWRECPRHVASLAVAEIRMRLSARLGNRITGPSRFWTLDHLLQPPQAPRRPWRTTARRGLLQRNPNRSAGAGSSLNQPGNCPRVKE